MKIMPFMIVNIAHKKSCVFFNAHKQKRGGAGHGKKILYHWRNPNNEIV